MPLGPYGADEYGHGQDYFPGCPRAFSARPGIQGPQVVLTWDVPTHPLASLIILRKVRECPRSPEDGVLVFEATEGLDTATSVVDLGDDLLPTDALEGEGRWWYYQAFVKLAPLPLVDQNDGTSKQLVLAMFPASRGWDMQSFEQVSFYVEALGNDPVSVKMQGAPSRDGPWVDLDITADVDAGAMGLMQAPPEANWVRVVLTAGVGAYLYFTPRLESSWLTSASLSGAVYVYKSGRHMRAAVEGGIPDLYMTRDEQQNTAPIFETPGSDGEVFNLGESGRGRGHLWKMLSIYLSEFDRVDAYLGAIRRYAADVDEMPAQEFIHVAEMLGYHLEVDGRNWNDVRSEIFRIAGVWKAKGTSRLIDAMCRQILGIVPRVQEGAGRVFRVADPTLYDAVPVNNDIHQIGN